VIALLLTLMLGAATLQVLRGGLVGPGSGLKVVGMDGGGLMLAVLAVAAAVWLWGWQYGVALVLTVAIHEFGHVAAFRVCGHDDARFRLIPLLGGYAISSRNPRGPEEAFFIALMGPAICLAPMAMAFALADLLAGASPALANDLYLFGLVMGALNFFNLLPLWPLDGGRITLLLIRSLAPGTERLISWAMLASAAALALALRSAVLAIFILLTWRGLMLAQAQIAAQPPMPPRAALTALGAYAATTLACAMGGWPLISRFF
jgi:Zn-dependent protease